MLFSCWMYGGRVCVCVCARAHSLIIQSSSPILLVFIQLQNVAGLRRLEGGCWRRLWPEGEAASEEKDVCIREESSSRSSLGGWSNWVKIPPQFLAKGCLASGPEITATCEETGGGDRDRCLDACRAEAVCLQMGRHSVRPTAHFYPVPGTEPHLSRVH